MPDDTNTAVKRFDRLRTSLNHLVNGQDPFTQESFLDGSVWKHPDISRMLKSIIDHDFIWTYLIKYTNFNRYFSNYTMTLRNVMFDIK